MKGIKNLLLLWVLLAIGIIVASTNHIQLMHIKPLALPESMASQALFVCPAFDPGAASSAVSAQKLKGGFQILFMFGVILWIAVTGWTFYQSLLKDKFEKKSWDLPIFFAKMIIFGTILLTIILNSPNHYRTVYVNGSNSEWVLCENNTPGARAVKADALRAN